MQASPQPWARAAGALPRHAPDPAVVDLCYDVVERCVAAAVAAVDQRVPHNTAVATRPPEGYAAYLRARQTHHKSAWEQLHPSAEAEHVRQRRALWGPRVCVWNRRTRAVATVVVEGLPGERSGVAAAVGVPSLPHSTVLLGRHARPLTAVGWWAGQSLSLELPMSNAVKQHVADYLSGSHVADNPLDYILSMLPIRPDHITPVRLAPLTSHRVGS